MSPEAPVARHSQSAPDSRQFRGPEVAAIREQMERMPMSPLFSHGKRNPQLFRKIVELALEGNTDDLKERYLGVHVFGRESGYDTTADPIVRATAADIRKRIAQYYHEPSHEEEIQIELLPGSYVPEFRLPRPKAPAESAPASLPAPVTLPERAFQRWRAALWGALAGSAIMAAAFLLVPRLAPKSSVDRFWAPVLEDSTRVNLCVARPSPSPSSSTQQVPQGPDIGLVMLMVGGGFETLIDTLADSVV